jgi:hypothetical protein
MGLFASVMTSFGYLSRSSLESCVLPGRLITGVIAWLELFKKAFGSIPTVNTSLENNTKFVNIMITHWLKKD